MRSPFPIGRRRRLLVPAALLALLPGVVRAQSGSPIDDFVEAALRGSHALAAADEEVGAREALLPGATLLPDPMVSLQYQNEGWEPTFGEAMDSFVGVMVSQPLPAGGKRELSGRLAEADVAAAKASSEVLRRAMSAALRRAVVDLLVARATLGEIETRVDTWSGLADDAAIRAANGLGSQSDLLMAQTERTRLLAERDEQAARIRGAAAALARLLPSEFDLDTGLARIPPLGELPMPQPVEPGAAADRAEEGSPWLAEARVSVDRSARSAELAVRNRRPDLTASATYMNRGSMDPMIAVGVSATLPIFRNRRQDAAVAAAEARRRAEDSRLERLRREVRAFAAQNAEELSAALSRIRTTETGVLVQQRLATESAVVSFRNGAGMFAAVFTALDRLASDELAAIGARGRALAASIALDEMGPGATAAPMGAGAASPMSPATIPAAGAQGGM